MITPMVIAVAWTIECLVGWPRWLFARIGHPVVWIGKLIDWLDQTLNREASSPRMRYAAGILTSLITLALMTQAAVMITHGLPNTLWGYFFEALVASCLIASRSLHTHVAAVSAPLMRANLDAARGAVKNIVGRDPEGLNAPQLASASLESLAENASDGVVAPVFWGALFGLPGIAFYKAANTLDSMIGHRSERYLAFGGFAARLDDVLNLVPARLTALLIVAASFNPRAIRIMWRDAAKHRSPNAGWPEAAMAGALGVRLSGPRSYGGEQNDEPWLHAEARPPLAADLERGLRVYRRALCLGAALLLIAATGGLYAV